MGREFRSKPSHDTVLYSWVVCTSFVFFSVGVCLSFWPPCSLTLFITETESQSESASYPVLYWNHRYLFGSLFWVSLVNNNLLSPLRNLLSVFFLVHHLSTDGSREPMMWSLWIHQRENRSHTSQDLCFLLFFNLFNLFNPFKLKKSPVYGFSQTR